MNPPRTGTPFIVYALPRSRTAWLSRFLNYGDYTCAHEQIRHFRGLDDARSWLRQDFTGTVETGAARWWRMVQHYRPDVRTVVVRRPVVEVVDSLMSLDMKGVCAFQRGPLTREMERSDRALDQIEERVPDVVSVSFDDLRTDAGCAAVFEHCLPYQHDLAWRAALAEHNIQASMPHLMRYVMANRPQIAVAASGARRQMRALLWPAAPAMVEPDHDGVVIQEEPFETFWRDGQALFAEHTAEIGPRDGVTLDINVPLIRKLDGIGCVQVMTARCNGRMFGYIASIIGPSLENPSLMVATQLPFFVSKDFRGLGTRLQAASIKRARERGVGEIIMRAGVRGGGPRVGALYKRAGAVPFGELFNLSLRTA